MNDDTKPPEPDFLEPFEGEDEPEAPVQQAAEELPSPLPDSDPLPPEEAVAPPAPRQPPAEAPPELALEASPPAPPRARPAKGPRPVLVESREPLYREAGGFRMRLEPADLARLRELPGSKGKTDRELGEEFFEQLATRFAESLAEDVTPPAEVRAVVDPYSRQAFLAIERTIRSILSF